MYAFTLQLQLNKQCYEVLNIKNEEFQYEAKTLNR